MNINQYRLNRTGKKGSIYKVNQAEWSGYTKPPSVPFVTIDGQIVQAKKM